MRWLDDNMDSMDTNLRKLGDSFLSPLVNIGDWHATVHGVAKKRHNLATEQQQTISVLFLFLQFPFTGNM